MLDFQRGAGAKQHVDLEACARGLGCLQKMGARRELGRRQDLAPGIGRVSLRSVLLVATLSRNAYTMLHRNPGQERCSMRHVIADVSSLELTENIIRTRAYQFYEERGYEDGHDLEDWLRAWGEIIGRIQKGGIRAAVA